MGTFVSLENHIWAFFMFVSTATFAALGAIGGAQLASSAAAASAFAVLTSAVFYVAMFGSP